MKFVTTAAVLRDALGTARAATPTTPNLVAYSGVMLLVKGRNLSVIGSDGDTTIAALVNVDGASDGQALLPPRPLAAYLATLDPGEALEVRTADDGDVEVAAGNLAPYRFRPVAASFPLPTGQKGTPTEADLSRLAAALAGVRCSIAKDNPGVQLVSSESGLVLNTTDNYRLSSVHLPEAGFGEFSGVVPLAVLDRASRHIISKITADARGRTLRCAGPDVVVSSKLLSTPFPAVDSVLQQPSQIEVPVNADLLRAALTRLGAVGTEAVPVKIRVDGDVVELSVTNLDLGSGVERVTLETTIDVPVEVAVNRAYLADAVASHAAEIVRLGYSGPVAPVFIRSSDPFETISVVMPVRV